MNKVKILIIVSAIASVALVPSLMSNQHANASNTGWCNQQGGKSEAWVDGCVTGWADHDHCKKYKPDHGNPPDYKRGYKVGWDRGHCKK